MMFRYLNILLTLWLLFLLPASAGINNPGSSGSQSNQGQIFLVLGGAGINAGTGYEYPFLNYMKLFSPQANTVSPGLLDSNGYPVSSSLPVSMQGAISSLPVSQTTPATTWVFKWTGLPSGTSAHPAFSFLQQTTITSDPGSCAGTQGSNTTFTGHSCRIEFTFVGTPAAVTIDFNAGANFDGTLAGLTLVRKSDEVALTAGGTFDPDFIARVKAARPRGLRLENWNNVNSNGNITANISDETPVSALSYIGHWNPASWAGIASGTNSYSGTLAGATLTDGTIVQIQFSNANSVSPTFNLNSLGAVQMADIGGTNLGATAIAASSNWTLVYDALLNKWRSINGDAGAGIPVAVLVALCNQVGTDLWYNIPIGSTDARVSAVSATIKSTLNSSLNAWYELSDEVWNPIYQSTALAGARGAALAFPTGSVGSFQQIWDYYALRYRQIMGDIATVYGTQANYREVLANWAAFLPSSQNTFRLQGFDLNGASNATYCAFVGGSFSGGVCSGDPGYNTFPNRPVDFSDAIAFAAYAFGAQTTWPDSSYVSLQSAETVTGGTNTNPVGLTIANHGYTTGQRIVLNSFTGSWAGLNSSVGTVVTAVDANHITVPFNATGFPAYSSNAGQAQRFSDELTGLLTAADQWAASDFSDSLTFLDNDVRAGTNYGVLSSSTISSFNSTSSGGLGIFPQWEVIMAGYDGASRPTGKANLIGVQYEGSIDPIYPSATSCTTLGISAAYCGPTGKIANLLGAGASASANSYKMSPQFQASTELLFDDFMAQPHSKYPAWYEIYAGDEFSLGAAGLYDPLFSSYTAIQGYHFP
jgi:hypothetical protein